MLLGDALKDVQKKHNEATDTQNLSALGSVATSYEILLNDAPEELVILFGLGTTKMQLGLNGAAITYLKAALNIKELPELWNNLGSAYKAEHHNDAARECWKRAMAMRDDADYYNNMVTLYVNEGCPEKGMEWAEKGLQINPDHARLHWNYSLLLLEQGRWKEGWDHYDYGLLSLDRPNRRFDAEDKIPFWDGTKGKRVVVYGEQGMGDEIMFASCIPELIEDCKEVIFECHPRMKSLFERSFGVECIPTRKHNIIEWPKGRQIDAKVAIGSLFGFYRNKGDFPKQPYLKPDPELVEKYQKRLSGYPKPWVGIGWQAGVKKTRTDLRSIKLKKFVPLMDAGGTFVSLQYSEGAQDKCARFFMDHGKQVHHWAWTVEGGPNNEYIGYNYDETIALLEALDLCVLPNTTAVHACGAIGAKCWTVTPEAAAWRYQLKGEEMPMYGDWVKQYRGDDSWEQIEKDYLEVISGERGGQPQRTTA